MLTYPDLSKLVDGPFMVTFTAHLPFPVGIPNPLGHMIWSPARFVSPEYERAYGERSFVNIRVFDRTESGMPMWKEGTFEALQHFYGRTPDGDPAARYGNDQFVQHNQWVTLETPCGELAVNHYDDPFHRCLGVFNAFLHAVLLITRDVRIRTITSYDLRPVVVIGAVPKDREWTHLTDMFMHPEAIEQTRVAVDKPFTEAELNAGLAAMINQKPYTTTAIWRSRAQRALRLTGDPTDTVISFQIAAESLLFDTYRMLLVDEGSASTELEAQLENQPFASLIKSLLPAKLGGVWDVTRSGTAVGEYWQKLYSVRNSIIHVGMQPHTGHAESAQEVYRGLRDYVEELLWKKYRKYPRSVYARFGLDGLRERGWLNPWMQERIEEFNAEPSPWYWPYDRARRTAHPTRT